MCIARHGPDECARLHFRVFLASRFSRQNFAGACDRSAVHSLMTKRALFVVVGFLGCCLSLSAQETRRPLLFQLGQPGQRGVVDTRATFSTLNSMYYGFPSLALLDRRLFSLSNGYNWIEAAPPDFLPPLSAEEPSNVKRAVTSRRDSGDKMMEVKPKFFDYVGGEVGVLYGHSAGGKFSGDVEQGYIVGEMGNDKTHITVGASYERSSGHISRH